MKSRVIVSMTCLLIAVLAFLNVNIVKNDNHILNVSFLNVEALASDESSTSDESYSHWGNFFKGQGFYKDERELTRACPSEQSGGFNVGGSYKGVTVGVEFNVSQVNPSTREEITCPVGKDNCSTVGC